MTQTTSAARVGVLLINVGTPDYPDKRSVGRFLARFLSDRRVITLPAFLRFVLVRCIIVPLRRRRSAREYQKVWMPEGSPLTVYSARFASKLQDRLGSQYTVRVAMRYSQPDIGGVLAQMEKEHLRHIIVLPMYPQNASSTTGAAAEEVFANIGAWGAVPGLTVVPPFFGTEAFIRSYTHHILQFDLSAYDAVLFSYHGLPVSHLPSCATSCGSSACTMPGDAVHTHCYKYQCLATTDLLVQSAAIPQHKVHSVFQSRFSKKWIEPYTDITALTLVGDGKKRILIVCPAFVADCVETIGEIGIHLRHSILASGGIQCDVVPCLNDDDMWAESCAGMVRKYSDAISLFQS